MTEARPLGTLLRTVKGKKPEHLLASYRPGLVPYIDIAAVEHGSKRQFADPQEARVVPAGTLVMVWDGARSGWTGLTRFEGALGSTLVALESPLERRYLGAFLRSRFGELNSNTRGSGIPHVNPDYLLALEVPMLPRDDQLGLACLTETVAEKVASSQDHMATARQFLNRFRQAVYAAACSGRLTADWRKHQFDSNVQVGVRSPEHFDIEVPYGWAIEPVGNVFRIQNGRAFPSAEYATRGVRLLRPGNLAARGDVIWDPERTAHLPQRWANEFPEYLLGRGELVMNLTAQSLKDEFLGRACIKSDSEPALLNQRIARFTNVGDADMRPYALLYFKSIFFRHFVNGLDSGTLIRHMHSKYVQTHRILLPPPDEQTEIVHRAADLLELADIIAARVDRAAIRLVRTADAVIAQAFQADVALNGASRSNETQAPAPVERRDKRHRGKV